MIKTFHRAVISAAVVALLGGLAAPAFAQARHRFDLLSQPLAKALNAFAAQAGMNIYFDPTDVEGRLSPALNTDATTDEALRQLLVGTGLSFRKSDDKTVMIVSPSSGTEKPTASSQQAGTVRLAQADGQLSIADDGQSASGGDVQEIVVTGSRVARSAFDMPTPVSVLDSAQIQQSGFNNIADVLNQLPSIGLGLSSSTGQFSNDSGAAFVNLRGLGTSRTLVLIDGRRRVSGSSDSSAVDLATIPASMIERVEIITGGASAVYGADAVSGVINVILKHEFTGLELTAQGGASQHGGADSLSASLSGGISFSEERGALSFAVTHNREQPLFASQRSFSDHWVRTISNPQNTGGADGIPDFTTLENFSFALLHPAGVFDVGGTFYTIDPQLRPLQVDPQSGVGINGDGWDFSSYFQQRMRTDVTSARSSVKYRLADRLSLFADAEFSSGKAFSHGAPNYDFGDVIRRDNPFVPADVAQLMDDNGVTELSLSRASVDQGIVNNDNSRYTYSIATGLQGSFGRDWNWKAFGQYGRYELTNRSTHQRWASRYFEAIDAIADPISGDPVCRSESARAAGCQALNLLGSNVATPEALAYFTVDSILRVQNAQTLAGAQLTGSVLELPAGPLQGALGVEYRKDTRAYESDPLAEMGLLVGRLGNTSLQGQDAVSEAFVELLVPLLRDKPFFHLLQMEGAARFSDYDSIGSTAAWKLGATWAPVSGLKLRATRSRSVRAPNLFELFSPATISVQGLRPENDPCDVSQINSNPNRTANCRALGVPAGWNAPAISESIWRGGGSLDLQEETSNAWTAGLVFTPRSVPGLSLAVDYWDIRIDSAVQALDGTSILSRCVDLADVNNVFCERITRDPTDYHVSGLDLSYLNIGALSADGVDIQAAYAFRLADAGLPLAGRMSVLLSASYLGSLRQLVDGSDPASVLVQDGRYDNPNWRANLALRYERQALRVALNTRLIGEARVDTQASLETYDRPRVPARIYNDLVIGYGLGERYDVRIGINNLFDTKPPATEQTYLGMYTLYESIGRFFTLGATARF